MSGRHCRPDRLLARGRRVAEQRAGEPEKRDEPLGPANQPVSSQGEELYHILRTRLFENLPEQAVRKAVANDYAAAVKAAREMDVTNHSPDSFAAQLAESYPFHFSLRDLYARFKENPGFQQTRGLIRLMRMIVSNLWNTNHASKIELIHPYDLDLNDDEIASEVRAINPTLTEAIAHDIANNGHSVAEELDSKFGITDAQDVSKLLLVASLANVPNATQGLRENDIVAFLCAPGRDISRVKKEVVDYLPTQSWYLHQSTDGRLFFKNIQNLAAKLHATARQYNQATQLKELQNYLIGMFQPYVRDVFQKVEVLPAIDEVALEIERVTLVIAQPGPNVDAATKLPRDWVKFWSDQEFKNRVLFLTGSQETLTHVLEQAAQYKAIQSIIAEMNQEKLSERDPQRQQANVNQDQIILRLRSAIQETFTTLVYPMMDQLRATDCRIHFDNNQFDGEKLIRETLTKQKKFEADIVSDSFRKRAEERLFQNQKIVRWSEVKRRAATNDSWPLHRADALDALRVKAVNEHHWHDLGDQVEKGPFPPPTTEVQVRLLSRDDATGEAHLKVTPLHGDAVYYEVGDTSPTQASLKANDAEGGLNNFRTRELKLRFLCVDSSGKHEAGAIVDWKNTIGIKHRVFQNGTTWYVELKAVPRGKIRCTTNGADPNAQGGSYDAPFALPEECRFVLAVASEAGIQSAVEKIDVQAYKTKKVKVEPGSPAIWKRNFGRITAREAFDFIGRLERFGAKAAGVTIDVTQNDGDVALTYLGGDSTGVDGATLRNIVAKMQEIVGGSQVALQTNALHFETGQQLLDWVADIKSALQLNEVVQP